MFYGKITRWRKKEFLRWCLPLEETAKLGERLVSFYTRFGQYFRTKTRDISEYGLKYISGLLGMENDRNLANVGRKTGIPGQNLQHFVSNSSWSGEDVILAVENEVKVHPSFREAVLVLDESAEEKAGEHSAGAGRQHNGRLGKIEMSQVGVFLALVTPEICTWIDGDLYLPQAWFEESHAEQRKQTGVPAELVFKTKPELGWEMIKRTQERQIPLVAVTRDDLYGRNEALRQNLNEAGIEYYGDIPATTKVYLEKPHVIQPLTKRGVLSKTAQLKEPLTKSANYAKRIGWSGKPCVCDPMNEAIWKPSLHACVFGLFMAKNPAKNGCYSAKMRFKSPMLSVMRPKPLT